MMTVVRLRKLWADLLVCTGQIRPWTSSTAHTWRHRVSDAC